MKLGVRAAGMQTPTAAADVHGTVSTAAQHRFVDFVSLTKPRLNLLVPITTLAGLYLAAPEGVETALLANTLMGTALVAGGAAALNQVWERRTDAVMRRTSTRPIPAGRLKTSEGAWFGLLLSAAGLAQLALAVNAPTAVVAGATLISYVLVYTPLKLRTSLATLVGGIPGALPAVIGWTAATGVISLPALVLFGIVFFWQMPHFLAIAWLFRNDYAHAGMFLHHLDDVQVLTALRIMDRLTTRGLIWNDLVRGPVEAIGVRLLALGEPATVRHDAIASVAAAFTRREALDLARRVGLSNVRYRRHLFGRFTLVSSKTR